jgi:carbonic anhydrase/acetyltransferase-like protein (isoleucine patch superfamily)
VHLADELGTFVGEWVTCGHRAILHACTVEDEVLIGMGATVMDGSVVGARSIVGAGALVTMERKIPPGSLVLGNPAKVVRSLDLQEQQSLRGWAERYVRQCFSQLAEEGRCDQHGSSGSWRSVAPPKESRRVTTTPPTNQ